MRRLESALAPPLRTLSSNDAEAEPDGVRISPARGVNASSSSSPSSDDDDARSARSAGSEVDDLRGVCWASACTGTAAGASAGDDAVGAGARGK